ncbi:MAG: hypothetical protein ACREXR_20210 [Gammaproteobacteria bacterium]
MRSFPGIAVNGVLHLKEIAMTTLEVKLNLPDELARQAQQAGLLTT